MASVTFTPSGTQLDNDEIADIQVDKSDRFGFNFTLDTSGLDTETTIFKASARGGFN
jgi:hypothetical protein